jgi:hypothetical protein
MTSLRKQYQSLVVDNSDKPVTTAPVQAAKLPDPVEPKPVEEIKPTEPSPVEEAAQSAIKQRVLEAERAAELAKQQTPHPQFAAEPEPQVPQMDPREQFEDAIQHLPARVQGWYRSHPEFLMDPEHAAKMTYIYHAAAREVGEADTDAHLDRMEHMLGLRHAAPQPEPRPSPERPTPPRAAPARQQGAPVSAPPSRESHSMSTGRPTGSRTTLTREEAELAKSLGITPAQYLEGRARMEREKAGGFHRDE